MVLGRPVFAQPLYYFTGYFIYVILIFGFNFKVVVGAIVKAYGSIPPYDTAAFLKEMGNVLIVMFFHEIHRPQDVDVFELRLLIVIGKMLVGSELGIRGKDPGTGEEPVYQVGIEGDFGICSDPAEKRTDFQFVIKILQEKISDIPLSAGRNEGA